MIETVPDLRTIKCEENNRNYDVCCSNAVDTDGSRLIIRKDSSVDHHLSDDWQVTILNEADGKVEIPLASAEIFHLPHHKDGDYIVLTAFDENPTPYHGPLTIRFGVDTNYHAKQIEVGYLVAHTRDENHLPALANRHEFVTSPDESEKPPVSRIVSSRDLGSIAIAA